MKGGDEFEGDSRVSEVLTVVWLSAIFAKLGNDPLRDMKSESRNRILVLWKVVFPKLQNKNPSAITWAPVDFDLLSPFSMFNLSVLVFIVPLAG